MEGLSRQRETRRKRGKKEKQWLGIIGRKPPFHKERFVRPKERGQASSSRSLLQRGEAALAFMRNPKRKKGGRDR